MKRNFAHNDLSGERVEVLPDPCVVHRGSGKGLVTFPPLQAINSCANAHMCATGKLLDL